MKKIVICPHCKGVFDASNLYDSRIRVQCPLCEDWIWLVDCQEVHNTNKLTQEQLISLLQECGFQFYVASGYWRAPDGKRFKELPTDLNNLFKYAVPKLLQEGYKIDIRIRKDETMVVINKGDFLRTGTALKLESALSWAIWEVIHGNPI